MDDNGYDVMMEFDAMIFHGYVVDRFLIYIYIWIWSLATKIIERGASWHHGELTEANGQGLLQGCPLNPTPSCLKMGDHYTLKIP